MTSVEDRTQPLVQNDHVGGFDGNVSSTPEGNPYLRLHESRRVIDTIAHHGYAGTLLKSSHHLGLVCRQNAGVNIFDARSTGEVFCRPLVVTCDQAGANAKAMQPLHGIRCIGSECIAQS
jgi:hypothetical protein